MSGEERERSGSPGVVVLTMLLVCAVLGAHALVGVLAWGALPPVFQRTCPTLPALLLLLAVRPAIDAAAARLLGRRGPLVAWLSLGACAPALWLATVVEVARHFQYNSPLFDHAGVFPQQVSVCALIVPVALAVAVPTVDGLAGGARRWLVFGAAAVTAAGGVALTAWLAVRAVRYPEPDRYEASLPLLGALPRSPGVMPIHLAPGQELAKAPPFRERIVAEGIVVERAQALGEPMRCDVDVGWDSAHPPRPTPSDDPDTDACGGLEIRYDAPHHVILMREVTPSLAEGFARKRSHAGPWHGAFRDRRERMSAPITMATFADRMAVPWTWPAWAAVSFLAAIGLLAAPSRARRLLGQRATWRCGSVDAEGRAWLDDATPLAGEAALTPGPVVVIGVTSGAGPFRQAPRAAAMVPGTPEALEAELSGELAARYACALAAAALATAPLAGAAVGMWG
jgi:hypothetical protein